MEHEKQVVSLELAKRMKELGFEQESYFYFKRTIDFSDYESEQLKIGDSYDLCYDESEFCEHSSDNKISAYTVAELGEMLPPLYNSYNCKSENIPKWECVPFYSGGDEVGDSTFFSANTEADARAKMLIYLKENSLI